MILKLIPAKTTQFSRGCDGLGEEEQGGPEGSDGDPRGEETLLKGPNITFSCCSVWPRRRVDGTELGLQKGARPLRQRGQVRHILSPQPSPMNKQRTQGEEPAGGEEQAPEH